LTKYILLLRYCLEVLRRLESTVHTRSYWECKLLVESPMPDRSKGMGQTNGRSRSFKLRGGREANNLTPLKTIYVENPNDGCQLRE
jgi:hypothetical protein